MTNYRLEVGFGNCVTGKKIVQQIYQFDPLVETRARFVERIMKRIKQILDKIHKKHDTFYSPGSIYEAMERNGELERYRRLAGETNPYHKQVATSALTVFLNHEIKGTEHELWLQWLEEGKENEKYR